MANIDLREKISRLPTAGLHTASPGDIVVLQDRYNPSGSAYIVCKTGNTDVSIASEKNIILVNLRSGRLVLRNRYTRVVVVPASCTIS